MSRMIVVVPTVITYVFLYSKYILEQTICNLSPAYVTVLAILSLNPFRFNSNNGCADINLRP